MNQKMEDREDGDFFLKAIDIDTDNKSIQLPMNTPVQITIGTDAMPGDILKFSIIDSPQYGVVTTHVGKPISTEGRPH